MATREAYARVWVQWKGREASVGIALASGDGERMIEMLQRDAELWAGRALLDNTSDSLVARDIERHIQAEHPTRPYFVEVDSGPDESRRGVQVFQPWGLPRTGTPAITKVEHEPGCFAQPRNARGCHCGRDHQ